jgi:hypothetical protein
MHNRIVIEKWFGNNCNNIVQLCHAIYLAEKTHSYLVVRPHDRGLLATHDFDFTEGAQIQGEISDTFFWLNKKNVGAKTIGWDVRKRILQKYVRPMLPGKLFSSTSRDGLVIHIRSGDVFRRKSAIKVFRGAPSYLLGLKRLLNGTHRVNGSFVQPPLVFYKHVIESKPWSQICIVAEDKANPVIDELLQSDYKIEFQQASLEEDITTLLAAKNLVVGYGTFGLTWALLSGCLESLYCPVLPERVFGELYPGDIHDLDVHTFEFRDYIPLGQWKASTVQKKMMLTYQFDSIVASLRRAEVHKSSKFLDGNVRVL